MKLRASIIVLTILTAISCESKRQKVEIEVNNQIEKIFASGDPKLWIRVEDEFYNRCNALGLFKDGNDRLDAFYDLMELVQQTGYPDEFYLKQDSISRQLVEDLKQIGYVSSDEAAQRFLYNVCKPIVDKYQYDTRDFIYSCGTINPDSTRISFDITAAEMPLGYNRPNLKRQGLYKVLLLFYLSKMIIEKQVS